MSGVPDPGQVLVRLQAAGRLPSVVAAVGDAGRVRWQGACSVLDREVGIATAYRIGSITKTMTAVLVLQARDEGLVALDTPLGSLVPGTGYPEATLGQLLAHTSGMQSEPTGPWWERSPGVDLRTLLAANPGSGRVAPASERHHYSNLGYALLGAAIEAVRGEDWWSLVRSRLLEPLGLAATTWDPPADHAPGLSVDHFAHTLTAEPHTDTGAMAPAGQLWSTVGDLVRWADVLAVGHPDVLAPATAVEMARPAAPATGYGLGLRLLGGVGGSVRLVGHTGSMPGFQASLFVDPATRTSVAVLADATTGLPSDRVAGMFLGTEPAPEAPGDAVAQVPWRPSDAVPARIVDLLGVWFWGNTAFGLEWQGDRVLLRDLRSGRANDRFAVEGPDVLRGVAGYHHGEVLRVHRRPDGVPGHLEVATFVLTRVPYDGSAPVPGGHPA